MSRSCTALEHTHQLEAHLTKVLIYTESWAVGGIEAYVMALLRNLSAEDIEFSLFTVYSQPGPFDEELRILGVARTSVFLERMPNQVARLMFGLRAFDKLIRRTRPDIVHINTMNGMGFAYSWVAQHRGVPIRIVHSHNMDVGKSMRNVKRIVGRMGCALFGHSATERLACSEEAGRYLFGNSKFEVVRNGIDTRRFAFSQVRRTVARESLRISPDALLFGNPSRLAPAKNPLFQLEVFADILKREPTALYLMLSEGEMAERVDAKAKELGVDKRLIRVSPRPDPEFWYCALDVLLFPSLFEGLGIVAIEAQCCGLPVLASDTVPSAAKITDLFEFLSVDSGAHVWGSRALSLARGFRNRSTYLSKVQNAGYDIAQTARRIGELYTKRSQC